MMSISERDHTHRIDIRLRAIRAALHAGTESSELRQNEGLNWADFSQWNNSPQFQEFMSTPGWAGNWTRSV